MSKVIIIGALVFTFILFKFGYTHGTVQTVYINVQKTERVTSGNSSKYLVFTDSETFENTDSLFHMKWNSSDIYGSISPGEYEAVVYGWRIPFLSWYRNIVSIERIK